MPLSTEDPSAHDLYTRGREAMDAGDYALAIARFRRSVLLDPHFKTLELLGECLLRVGQPAEAAIYLAAAAGLGSRQSRPRYLLAQALVQIECRDWAADKLREALAFNPTYRRARELLAELEAERNEHPSVDSDP